MQCVSSGGKLLHGQGNATGRRDAAERLRITRQSGLGRKQFCEQRGITLTTFDYWRHRLQGKPRLLKVKVAASEPMGQFVLMLANGRRIEFVAIR